MSTVTPRRSNRVAHTHTPKMSERKKNLFLRGAELEEPLRHRRLSVVDSESDSNDCDLGIISTLDSSSGDENYPVTPERMWRGTRSHTRKLQESQDLKHFMKSPFTLKQYQTRYSGEAAGEAAGWASTPATPRPRRAPSTPSSAHSSASAAAAPAGRARRSLASLIADAESCSSSLKDLNFDSDSGADSKENTPARPRRRDRNETTPRYSFRGVLVERGGNGAASPVTVDTPASPPPTALGRPTRIDIDDVVSPASMLKTPHAAVDARASPPRLGPNRRSVGETRGSPGSAGGDERAAKRLRYDDSAGGGGAPEHARVQPPPAPRARLALFGADRLKEILSAKSFYGRTDPEMTVPVSDTISRALEVAHVQRRRRAGAAGRRRREPGQINGGVRHRIRKPRAPRRPAVGSAAAAAPAAAAPAAAAGASAEDTTVASLDSTLSQEEKADPFDTEKRTIDALLSQWTEEELPETELALTRGRGDACLRRDAIGPPPLPAAATPVPVAAYTPPAGAVLAELGGQTVLPDLDEIERELRQLDEELLQMAHEHRLPAAVLAAADLPAPPPASPPAPPPASPPAPELFPIFRDPNPGISTTPPAKGVAGGAVLRGGCDQYVIDAGQRALGAAQCPECGVVYQRGDPRDERDHRLHHDAADVLRFPGWKEECVVGRWGAARALRVRGGAAGWRRVAALLRRLLQPALGLPDLPRPDHVYTAYLYIESRRIVACAVLEPRTRAYRMLPGEPPCCSREDYPVKCGVARIWTAQGARRRGVAARLLECARASLLHGAVLERADVAFSAPTPDGAAFAAAYAGTPRFPVYLD
ncbi:nascent polypeptide-associated complex subunit alpha, muscle-specific form [Aricia agestis]|uniref:nascent polypeptide-associated complex subunit alpha, muscle-specific form n=1 Tax=Aricia agestis TaxID=91739 RepID=UPI001C20B372|nr:nascent polypeptide-associated complex subunit alpha, muscle-specific form [Aricia agestis]